MHGRRGRDPPLADAGGTGVVLRFATFDGPEGHHMRDMQRLLPKRIAPHVTPAGFLSSIHLDDAATAVVAALDAPSGTYNVVDDEPLTRREWVDAFAAALGVKPPRFVLQVAKPVGAPR